MSFFSLIIKNPFRNKSRAFLAIIGIGIGIATIVALGGITDGLIASAEDTLHSGGSDITIMGSQDSSSELSSFSTSKFSDNYTEKILGVEGVKSAIGVYSTQLASSDGQYVSIVGINHEDVGFTEAVITEGRLFSDDANEIILGKLAKDEIDANIGDKITYGNKEYEVVGFF